MAVEESNGISADEVALYDRQIRLWGMAAQERMRNAHVLVISIKALANEVVKNLVLAGIGAITLLDHETVTEEDLGGQFLVEQADLGRNRAEAAAEKATKLNPRVKINVDQAEVNEKNEAYYADFDITVVCSQDARLLYSINEACRSANKPFYASDIPGLSGYIFADLIRHQYVTEYEVTNASGEKVKGTQEHSDTWSTMEEALSHDYGAKLKPKLRKKLSPMLPLNIALLRYRAEHRAEPGEALPAFSSLCKHTAQVLGVPEEILDHHVDTFAARSDCELSSVAAIVGGVLSQDVLNVLSGREHPIQNFFVYDAETGDGPIYKL